MTPEVVWNLTPDEEGAYSARLKEIYEQRKAAQQRRR